MRLGSTLIVLSLAAFSTSTARGDTALRLSPVALEARLTSRLLPFERLGETWNIGGLQFSPQRYRSIWNAKTSFFGFDWDNRVFRPQKIQLRSLRGEILLEQDFDSGFFKFSQDKSLRLEEIPNPLPAGSKIRLPPLMIKVPTQELKNFAVLQICVVDQQNSAQAEICVPTRGAAGGGTSELKTKGQKLEGKGRIEFKEGSEIDWLLTLVNNVKIRVRFSMNSASLNEIRLGQNGELHISFYSENAPAMKFSPLTEERSWFFQPTIGDLRRMYSVTTPNDVPYLTFQGPFSIKVQQKVDYAELIQVDSQIYLSEPAPKGTYGREILLEGSLPEGYLLAPGQDNVKMLDGSRFQWTFPTPQEKAYNIAEIKISPRPAPEKIIHYDYEVYRGHSTYLSARLGASLTSNLGFSGAMDFQAMHWFNEPLGTNSFSRQRWGISAGYAETLFSTAENEKYKTSNLTAYMRFTPGLDNWTESFGLWTGAMTFQYRDTLETTLYGGGLFWTRSLPPWFNYFLGVTKFLRSPKWVHFSGGIYPVTLTSGVESYVAEAKAVGRIEVSHNTFFEGGWAVIASSATYRQNNGTVKVNMGAGRGYLGFGYEF